MYPGNTDAMTFSSLAQDLFVTHFQAAFTRENDLGLGMPLVFALKLFCSPDLNEECLFPWTVLSSFRQVTGLGPDCIWLSHARRIN